MEKNYYYVNKKEVELKEFERLLTREAEAYEVDVRNYIENVIEQIIKYGAMYNAGSKNTYDIKVKEDL